MILYYIVDFLFLVAEKILISIDGFGVFNTLDVVDFVSNLFKYANVLFPFTQLTPVLIAFATWYSLRLTLAVFGFIKKYIPIA